tara:strand:+ start:1484 stop:3343 length:1860 start_codon:yes stop_codon:yes gene_type:complete
MAPKYPNYLDNPYVQSSIEANQKFKQGLGFDGSLPQTNIQKGLNQLSQVLNPIPPAKLILEKSGLPDVLGKIYSSLTATPQSTKDIEKVSSVDKLRIEEDGVPLTPAELIQQQLQSVDQLRIAEDKDLINAPSLKTGTETSADGDGADTTVANITGADAGATDPTIPKGVSPEDEGLPSDEFIDPTKKQSDLDKYTQNLVDETVDKYSKLLAEDSKGNTRDEDIQKYKQEFFEATGIDPSGKPDMRAAMTALGLHLMQNKAGKKFNVGKMLNEVGKAGEAALPLAESALKEAKAGQLAGGKYALGEIAKDEASRSASLKEQRAALNEINVNNLDFQQKRQLQFEKSRYDMDLEDAKHKNEAIIESMKPQSADIGSAWDRTPISGFEKGMRVRKAFDKVRGKEVILNGASASKDFMRGYGNILQATTSIDQLEDLVLTMGDQTGSSAGDILIGKANEIMTTLGFPPDLLKEGITVVEVDANGNKVERTIEGVSAASQGQVVVDRLLAQYKRFLSKETGNGISEGDFQRLEKLAGAIGNVLTPTNVKSLRLKELRTMFDEPKKSFEDEIALLADRDYYLNEKEYQKALSFIQQGIGLDAGNLGVTASFDDNNMLVYDLTVN